jgi:ABC-type nitrate/sulfonate/bicarbonate transport system substrate-binding protein
MRIVVGRALGRVVGWLLNGVVFASALVACRPDADGAPSRSGEPTELRYLQGLGNVSFPELAEDLGYLAPLRLEWRGIVLGGPEAIQAVTLGDVDFGSAATGSVIKLIAAGAPIRQVIASGGVDSLTWGGYFVLEQSPLHAARDLIGKKISVNTLGAHAEFMIREWLTRGGLARDEIDQVTLVVTPPLNGEQALRQASVDVASLGGILRDKALERGGIRPLFTDRDLFGDFNSTTFVLRTQFIEEHPVAARTFVDATARAIEWARANPPDTVRERFRHILERRGRGEDPSLSRYWRSVGVNSRGGLLADKDMQIWLDWLTKQGDVREGQLDRASDLYTNELNPFRNTLVGALAN